MKLINAEELVKTVRNHQQTVTTDGKVGVGYSMAHDHIIEIINLMETDELVHCKECKHLGFKNCYGICERGYLGVVKPWDFCSRGERMKKE